MDFKLNIFESAKDTDNILNQPIDESSEEFAPDSNATADVDVGKSATVPTAKGTTISEDQYNSALSAVKKSFQEGIEIMNILESATITKKTIEDEQQEFTENAIFESFCDGPIFEAVDREDKAEIKTIAKKIRKKAGSFKRSMDNIFKGKNDPIVNPPKFLEPSILACCSGVQMYAWQTIGVLELPSVGKKATTINDAISKLTEEFEDDLGEYKIKPLKVNFFVTSFIGPTGAKDLSDDEKNSKRKPYHLIFLIVDKDDKDNLEELNINLDDAESKKFINVIKSSEK